jgi:hypothetical protein
MEKKVAGNRVGADDFLLGHGYNAEFHYML